MHDGALTTDIRRLNRNGPDGWQHNRHRYASRPKIPTRPAANKESPCEKFPELPISDREIESREGIENNEDGKPRGCAANQPIPDRACSPGAVLTTNTDLICASGYASTVRDVPVSEKEQVFAGYGID
jgi:hypothetical protein